MRKKVQKEGNSETVRSENIGTSVCFRASATVKTPEEISITLRVVEFVENEAIIIDEPS